MSSSGSAEPTRPAEPAGPALADATPGSTPDDSGSTPDYPDSPATPGGGGARLASRRRPRPVFLVVGITAAVVLAAVLAVVSGGRSGPSHPRVGGTVPTFTLPRLGAGGTVGVPATGGGRGRPAVLLFFASWCTPCQHEIPALAAAYRHQQSGHSRLARVALIGVDGNDPTADALGFVRRSGVTFPVGADPAYAVTSGQFDFSFLPESVMVNGNGTIDAIHYGALSSADLVHWERALLSGSG